MFPKIVVPQNGWFIMENLFKMDDLGLPLFFGNTHIPRQYPLKSTVSLAKIAGDCFKCDFLSYCRWFRFLDHQLRFAVYPIIYRVLQVPGGCLGFLPSTVYPIKTHLVTLADCSWDLQRTCLIFYCKWIFGDLQPFSNSKVVFNHPTETTIYT